MQKNVNINSVIIIIVMIILLLYYYSFSRTALNQPIPSPKTYNINFVHNEASKQLERINLSPILNVALFLATPLVRNVRGFDEVKKNKEFKNFSGKIMGSVK